MTTGRINQVTVVQGRQAAQGRAVSPVEPSRSWAEQLTSRGAASCEGVRPTRRNGRRKPGDRPTGHPIAPTEFLKGRSTQDPIEPPKRPPQAWIYAPQEEETFRGSRPRAAIGMGLPPNV